MDGSQSTAAANRCALIALLRSPPDGFKWDFGTYGNCDGTRGCAVTLARRIGFDISRGPFRAADTVARLVGAPDFAIFCSPSYYGVRSYDEVTAEMVADALERIDAPQEEPVSHLTGREQDAAAGLVPLSSSTAAAATPAAPEQRRLDPFPVRALR